MSAMRIREGSCLILSNTSFMSLTPSFGDTKMLAKLTISPASSRCERICSLDSFLNVLSGLVMKYLSPSPSTSTILVAVGMSALVVIFRVSTLFLSRHFFTIPPASSSPKRDMISTSVPSSDKTTASLRASPPQDIPMSRAGTDPFVKISLSTAPANISTMAAPITVTLQLIHKLLLQKW